jgi:acetyl-CoA acetyltransferase
MSRDVYVLDAVRTPIGRYGGGLAGVRPDDLGSLAWQLHRRGGGRGLAAICIGVGQGLAVVFEA